MTASASAWPHAGAAALCLLCALLILGMGGRRSAPYAAAAAATSLWLGLVAVTPTAPLLGAAGAAETLRGLAWCALLLLLCRRTGGPAAAPLVRRFALAAGLAGALAIGSALTGDASGLPSLGSSALLGRLGLALVIVLCAENLYRNATEAARWHVNLTAIALGGLAAFDLMLYADAALSRAVSRPLLDARAALTILALPLLVIATLRDQRSRRSRRDPPVSRAVVFHSASLVVAGAFLLGVGAAGEALRHLGTDWGSAAQASLIAGAVMALAVALASRSARSRLRRLVVDHFFLARYDYRAEWHRCVATLSAPEAEAPAPQRAIRAIADAVDSPAGVLLLREAGGGLHWAGSWNLPHAPLALPPDHALLRALGDGSWIARCGSGVTPEPGAAKPALLVEELRAAFGALWLTVPLPHHRDGLLGVVLLAPPRAPFDLDGEVFDLLRTLGREVAMFLAERRAAERLADQRGLEDYARRFAFVAHDVKTVASQLGLVLANAEHNIDDPDFQRDMLLTLGASVERIHTLIARLRQPAAMTEGVGATALPARLRALAAGRRHPIQILEEGGALAPAAIAAETLDAAITHLVDNAVEASPPDEPVRLRLRQDAAGRILLDIIDRGSGMTPEFIRDELFRPLATSKPHGSGIGAWQARELLRSAGGDLTVLSSPGAGTTMRLILPSAAKPLPLPVERRA
jgi:putative PEP-CTERM system histidine kinase